METLDASSGGAQSSDSRATSSKLRRSCELCRASKEKCIPSKEGIRRCQKCLKDQRQCVFLEAKGRPKRAKSSKTRVAEMEERLEGLVALLSSATNATKEKEATTTSSRPKIHSMQAGISGALPAPFSDLFTTFSDPSEATQLPEFFSTQHLLPRLVFDDFDDVISKGVISFQEAERSMHMFRTKACNFPFVVVPLHMSLDAIRREKPFLILTILAWGAQETFKLQKALELEIREQLSKKVVMNSEKSLDLLQGLLIYLCWYRFYFKPERQQIYQLSQMATSMAVDLCIHQPVQSPSHQDSLNFLDPDLEIFNVDKTTEDLEVFMDLAATQHTERPSRQNQYTISQLFKPRNPSKDIEAKRTFLGCYWLSSAVAMGLRKPTSLKYTDYVGECIQVLDRFGDAETDYLLAHFIALQKFAEDVNHAFDYNNAFLHPQLDATRVEILSKTFTQRLDQLRSSFPLTVWSNVQISMSFHFLRIYINEVGFHASPCSPQDLISGQPSLNTWYFAPARNESLIACLQASKSYLDRFIELTPSQTLEFLLPDLVRLAYAVLVIGRFTSGCDCPVLDASSVRKTANMGYYLDKLIEKADEVILLSPEKDANDWIFHVRKLWQQSKQWLERIVISPIVGSESVIGQPELNFMNILPSSIKSIVDFSGAGAERFDERWGDVLDWNLNTSVPDLQ